MKHQNDGGRMWMEVEDRLVPGLRLTLIERVVYCHLLRHTRAVRKRRLRCTMTWLGQGAGISHGTAREAVRSLAYKGALKIIDRGRSGHLVELRLPREVPACKRPEPAGIEASDFYAGAELRQAIYRREGDRCFYCLRRLRRHTRALDHVVPRANRGRNSYRNVVACCLDCNADKGSRAAGDLLRKLYRQGRLSAAELAARLAALKALARGKLKPKISLPAPPPICDTASRL